MQSILHYKIKSGKGNKHWYLGQTKLIARLSDFPHIFIKNITKKFKNDNILLWILLQMLLKYLLTRQIMLYVKSTVKKTVDRCGRWLLFFVKPALCLSPETNLWNVVNVKNKSVFFPSLADFFQKTC